MSKGDLYAMNTMLAPSSKVKFYSTRSDKGDSRTASSKLQEFSCSIPGTFSIASRQGPLVSETCQKIKGILRIAVYICTKCALASF